MKQTIFIALVFLYSITSFSQDLNFSLELNYPIPIDNNFIGENYSGILDIGAKYRIANLSSMRIGVALNCGVLTNNSNQNNGFQDFKVTAYVFQPKLFGELNIGSLDKLHPTVGLGYTVILFDVTGTNNGFDVSGASDTQSGFNFNVGLAYDISNKLFVQAQYDFVKLGTEGDIPDIKYNTNVNIFKIGLGYRI